MADMPWKDAIEKTLQDAGQALHYKTIAEEIANKKLRTKLGATPARTVGAIISISIKNDGEDTPFLKTNSGMYMLKKRAAELEREEKEEEPEEDVDRRIVRCVGMYWHHSKVSWRTKPRILGQEQQGAKEIDFSNQIGVYLLHDRSRIIYVGRSIDRPLGVRLSEHTRDRLNGRWDRFSWFGLRGVDDDGKLTEPELSVDLSGIVSLMEAILIESLEPPQNRKRGDDFSDIEYIQVADKEKEAQKRKAIISMLEEQLSNDE